MSYEGTSSDGNNAQPEMELEIEVSPSGGNNAPPEMEEEEHSSYRNRQLEMEKGRTT